MPCQSFCQLIGKVDLRQLGLGIRFQGVIVVFALQIRKIDLPDFMPGGADIHDARWSAGLQHVDQLLCEQKVSQVIGREGGFQPIRRHLALDVHAPSVIDQHM